MTFQLVCIEPKELTQYKSDMQEAFQKGFEDVFGKTDAVILPEKDIDQSLNAEGSAVYKAVVDGEMVGGAVVIINESIDNFIHTYAGMELRLKMHEIMAKQGHEEETGKAKITSGYNLPTKYILHTVGPIIQWKVTKEDEDLLASCYTECLKLAADTGVESIAFCCLSTGVFRFPQQRAAEIATSTVKQYLNKDSRIKKVIFNVFKDEDLKIYSGLL